MNYIWGAIMVVSVVCGIINGKTAQLSAAALDGAKDALELLFTMCGMMCLWSGLMNIAERGGLTAVLARVFSPVLRLLFPEYKDDKETSGAICSNVTANLLGLGNAATPLGIEAMRRMQMKNPENEQANNSMIMFVVINTASLQLVPTTIAILRQKYGSPAPLDILPCIWLSSVFALLVGVTAAKLLEGRSRKKQRGVSAWRRFRDISSP